MLIFQHWKWPAQRTSTVPIVRYGRGSFLLWRRCDALCISGFVGDFIFVLVGFMEACRCRCMANITIRQSAYFFLFSFNRTYAARLSCNVFEI